MKYICILICLIIIIAIIVCLDYKETFQSASTTPAPTTPAPTTPAPTTPAPTTICKKRGLSDKEIFNKYQGPHRLMDNKHKHDTHVIEPIDKVCNYSNEICSSSNNMKTYGTAHNNNVCPIMTLDGTKIYADCKPTA